MKIMNWQPKCGTNSRRYDIRSPRASRNAMENQLKNTQNLIPFQNDGTVIMSTTISLSRNIAGYKFVSKASSQELLEILNDISDTVYEELGSGYTYNDVEFQDPFLADTWVEDQLTSPDYEDKDIPRGIFTAKNARIAIVINDINHLKIQITEKYLQPERCWTIINQIDDIIENRVHYSFSPQFGYLTTNLQDAGTGMKMSVEMHLPALAMNGSIGDLYDFAEAKDLFIEGCRGNCDPEGDMFRITNNITIGVSEEDIIKNMKRIVTRIAQFELQTRRLLLSEKKDMMTDSALRALGVLKFARMINYIEASNLISKVKLGILTGVVKGIPLEVMDKLLRKSMPARLNYDNCEILDYQKEEILRAEMIRDTLNSLY
jgi:protein arginine kinase